MESSTKSTAPWSLSPYPCLATRMMKVRVIPWVTGFRTVDMLGLTDEHIRTIRRGGHDPDKVYAAYRAATEYRGAPSVVLAKTIAERAKEV